MILFKPFIGVKVHVLQGTNYRSWPWLRNQRPAYTPSPRPSVWPEPLLWNNPPTIIQPRCRLGRQYQSGLQRGKRSFQAIHRSPNLAPTLSPILHIQVSTSVIVDCALLYFIYLSPLQYLPPAPSPLQLYPSPSTALL